MNIKIITVGKLKEKYLKDAIAEYSKRLSRYCRLDIIELPDEKTSENASEKEEEIVREKEGRKRGREIAEKAEKGARPL